MDPERSERSGIKIRGPQEPADKAKDPDTKQFSSKFDPMIKSHLEMAQTTGEQLKVASNRLVSRADVLVGRGPILFRS